VAPPNENNTLSGVVFICVSRNQTARNETNLG